MQLYVKIYYKNVYYRIVYNNKKLRIKEYLILDDLLNKFIYLMKRVTIKGDIVCYINI